MSKDMPTFDYIFQTSKLPARQRSIYMYHHCISQWAQKGQYHNNTYTYG